MQLKFNTKYDLEDVVEIKSCDVKVQIRIKQIVIFFDKNRIIKKYDTEFVNEALQKDYGGFKRIKEEDILSKIKK